MKKQDTIMGYIEYGLFIIFIAIIIAVPLALLFKIVGIESNSILSYIIILLIGFLISFNITK